MPSEARGTTASAPEPPIGPGTLVLVVGPSGAGKDTLLRLAATRLDADTRIVFPRRIITRPPDGSEANEEIDAENFAAAERDSAFALAWRAHGHCYGISKAVIAHLNAGRTVVVNASRRIIDDAMRRFAKVEIVLVTARPETLARRLASRGRDPDVAGRLDRRLPVESRCAVTIENEGSPEDAAATLVAFLTNCSRRSSR